MMIIQKTPRTGYIFAGWYKEAECLNSWNFVTDQVSGDITLFASWNSVSSANTYLSSEFKVFPIPARDFVTIEGENITQIELYDISGKSLIQLNPNDKKSYTINMLNFKPGMYLLSVKKQNSSTEVIKLLKK